MQIGSSNVGNKTKKNLNKFEWIITGFRLVMNPFEKVEFRATKTEFSLSKIKFHFHGQRIRLCKFCRSNVIKFAVQFTTSFTMFVFVGITYLSLSPGDVVLYLHSICTLHAEPLWKHTSFPCFWAKPWNVYGAVDKRIVVISPSIGEFPMSAMDTNALEWPYVGSLERWNGSIACNFIIVWASLQLK